MAASLPRQRFTVAEYQRMGEAGIFGEGARVELLDLALIRHSAAPGAPFTPADVLMVIEVADSSREYDRETKLRCYAAAGIPEAWLADLVAGVLERHSEPCDGLYRQVALGRPGDTLASTVLPGLAIPVGLALGQPQ